MVGFYNNTSDLTHLNSRFLSWLQTMYHSTGRQKSDKTIVGLC